jgi:hypothetical protein
MRPRLADLTGIVIMTVVLAQSITAQAERPPWKRRGRRRTCYIQSEPEQAAVYIEKKKHGIACYTPCKIRLPYRKTFKIFLKKPGFKEKEAEITVGRRRRNRRFRFVLKREVKPAVIDVRADTSGSATGGHIYVDGVALGTVPSQVKVKPGRHQVEVKKKGFKTFDHWVTLKEGQIYTLVVPLKSKAKPKGSILVTSDPVGAEVYVDGKRVDTTPTVITGVAPGAHTVEVRKKGTPVWKQVVEVKPNAQVKVIAKLKKKERPKAVKTGAVRVLSNVAKADVYVDGELKGQAPVTVKNLIPGDHLVEVRAEGYLPKEMRVQVKPQQQSLVKLDLEEKPKEKAIGTLRVQSAVPGAEVFLDGASVGKAPVRKEGIPAGEHIVVVRKPGYKDYRVKVDVEKGKEKVVTAELKSVGFIKVVTKQPGADVLIDSVKVGETPLSGYELEAGEYTLEVRRPKGGYEPHRVTFKIEGGERRNFSVELRKKRKGPSPAQVAAIKKGLSSYGARSVPPGSFIADVSMGFPYIVNAKLTVGAWKQGMFGIDAGFSFRSLFLYMNEFAINARGQLFQRGPFSVGAFTELGAGVGLGRRNSFFWNLGPIISLSFKNLVTASLILWFNVYSDRICRSSPADRDAGETEPSLCKITEGWPEDPDGVGPRDPDTQDGSRPTPYQVVGGGDRVYLNPKPFAKHSLRKRFNGWKFYLTFVVETALTNWLNVFLKIDFVPAQDSQQRALYMEYFTASSFEYHDGTGGDDPKVTTKGVLPEVDWGIYGQAGVSFKF